VTAEAILSEELGDDVTALALTSRALNAKHVQLASDIAEGDIGPRHAIYCSGLLHACLQRRSTYDDTRRAGALRAEDTGRKAFLPVSFNLHIPVDAGSRSITVSRKASNATAPIAT